MNKELNKPYKIFLCGMSVLIGAFILMLLIFPDSQTSVFLGRMNDLTADFHNTLRYIADRDPYFCTIGSMGDKNYLPIAYMILYPFSQLCDYTSMALQDCWHNSTAMWSVFVYMLLQILIFVYAFYQLAKMLPYRSWLLSCFLFSGIFIFSVERGNMQIMVSAFMVLFLAWRDSSNKARHYMGMTALCMAALLKIYPVLLGIVLIKEKRWKDIAYCVCFSICLTFLPFLFFKHQFANIPQMFYILGLNSDNAWQVWYIQRFGIAHYAYGVVDVLNIEGSSIATFMTSMAKIVSTLLSLTALCLALVKNKLWKSVALVILTAMMFPANSGFYVGMYLMPVIILFFMKSERESFDIWYAILFCIILNPLQIGTHNKFSYSAFISNIAAVILWITLIYQTLHQLIQQKNSRQSV